MVVLQPVEECTVFLQPLRLDPRAPLAQVASGFSRPQLHFAPVFYRPMHIPERPLQARPYIFQLPRAGSAIDLELHDRLGKATLTVSWIDRGQPAFLVTADPDDRMDNQMNSHVHIGQCQRGGIDQERRVIVNHFYDGVGRFPTVGVQLWIKDPYQDLAGSPFSRKSNCPRTIAARVCGECNSRSSSGTRRKHCST